MPYIDWLSFIAKEAENVVDWSLYQYLEPRYRTAIWIHIVFVSNDPILKGKGTYSHAIVPCTNYAVHREYCAPFDLEGPTIVTK